jgi:hypothetical protein
MRKYCGCENSYPEIQRDLHVVNTPEYKEWFLESCLPAYNCVRLTSAWMVGQILFIFGK